MIPMIPMIALLCASVRADDDRPVVGLPLDRLDALGLGLPTVPAAVPLQLRYPLAGGGFVVLVVGPTEADASAAFEGLSRTAATHWASPAAGTALPGQRTLGDGAAALLVQSGNAAVFVRDLQGRAADVAARVLAAVTRDPEGCSVRARPTLPDGRPSDGCGRPVRSGSAP